MKSSHPDDSIYKVQALMRALDILDCFNYQNRKMSLTDVVNQTGLNKTTAKRLISNLTARGYLQQDPQSKCYHLGMRLFELGSVVFSSFSLRQAAAQPMNNLQEDTAATVLLGSKIENHLVYVDKREGHGKIRISSDIGWRRPLHYGMLGMVLMAHLEPKDLRRIIKMYPLQPHTALSITDEDAFILRLGKIHEKGYIVEKEEAVEGFIGIAVPIRDYSRQVVAALGVALPREHPGQNTEIDRIVGLVKRAGEDVSSDLGYLMI
jgi:IclR family transcriptional regulator, KDG regulon repressor